MLQRTLRSLIDQTRLPDEVVVCDDCSDENLEQLVRNTIDNRTHVKYLRNERRMGANPARNRAVEATEGDVLMFLDDDDCWLPRKVERQLAVLAADESVGLVYSTRAVVGDSRLDEVLYEIPASRSGRLFPEILYRNWIGTPSSVALRKSVFVAAGGFDEQLSAIQDWDLWIRCCKLTTVAADQTVGVLYTINTSRKAQISRDFDARTKAAEYLLAKYSREIEAQGRIGARRIRSEVWGKVARSAPPGAYTRSFRYACRSFLAFPTFRNLSAFLPDFLRLRLRRSM